MIPSFKDTPLPQLFRNSSPAGSYTVMIGVLIFLVLISWMIYKTLDTGLRIKTVSTGATSLAKRSSIAGSVLPSFVNGSEFGVSIWLYLNTVPSKKSTLVALNDAPLMFFGGTNPNIQVMFTGVSADLGDSCGSKNPCFSYKHVSLGKWVNLIAVHKDGVVTLLKDGEIFSVNHLGNNTVAIPESSTLHIGDPMTAVDGFVSNIVVLNHFPSTREVKSIYNAGPRVSNWLLSSIGLSGIGIRSPVYRISA